MRNSLRATFGIFPFGQFEEMGKQNMALFERTLRMLSPYGRDSTTGETEGSAPSPEKPEPSAPQDPHLRRLEEQIEALRKQLEALGRDRKEGVEAGFPKRRLPAGMSARCRRSRNAVQSPVAASLTGSRRLFSTSSITSADGQTSDE